MALPGSWVVLQIKNLVLTGAAPTCIKNNKRKWFWKWEQIKQMIGTKTERCRQVKEVRSEIEPEN